MRRLIFLVLLVLVLSVPLFGQNESEIKQGMRKEMLFLKQTLNSILMESEKTETAFSEILMLNAERESELNEKLKSLRLEKKQVEERLTKLEADYNLLNDSKDSWTSLNEGYDLEIEILEGQVRLWRGIAIGSGVAVVAVVTYIIIKGVTE